MPGAGLGGATAAREAASSELPLRGGPVPKDRVTIELYYCAYKSDAPDCCGDVMRYHESASWIFTVQILGFSFTYEHLVQEVSKLLCTHFKIEEASGLAEQRWPNGQAYMQLSGSMWVDWNKSRSSRITPRTFPEVMVSLRGMPNAVIKARCTLMQDIRAEEDIVQANKSVTRWKCAEMERIARQRKQEEDAEQAAEERRRSEVVEVQRKQVEADKPTLVVRSKKSFAGLKKKASRAGELWFHGTG
ncbi:hypothetical protein LTR78_007286 [Recurvomyces mirabilis]|uniref:Uncharacterized protein n=1 Tax=Recurvomyces mirabilis TaxID=574656 RepID=A0AAE1BYT2_9PEZI|nr:hypothetical protein LTR78_007286 [Recurvomyces mirabilis]KAK5155473.1 hypothetical protein LTS14_005734 [Recurvomyces mirabilis]